MTSTASKLNGPAFRLVEAGLLEIHGSDRTRRYDLSAGFFAFAEDRNAYVRVRPADTIQQEQAVVTYVHAYGPITRGQAADLCRIAPQQSRRLLKRLTEAGLLELRG